MMLDLTIRLRRLIQTPKGKAAAIAGGLLLLFALGVIIFLSIGRRPPTTRLNPKAAAPAGNTTVYTIHAPPSLCNLTRLATGGAGRCYPSCERDSDCSEARGRVSGAQSCALAAAAICGSSAECLTQICGSAKAVCRRGFCSRPDLDRDETGCSADPKTRGEWRGLCPGAKGAVDCTAANMTACAAP